MKAPKWVTARMVLAIHEEAIARFGGGQGVRDEVLLESGLNKPQNVQAYVERATLFDMAAAVCEGIAHNHPFLDGNKRTALLAARAFLVLNGWAFEPEEADEVEMMVGFATRRVDTPAMSAWFRKRSSRSKVWR